MRWNKNIAKKINELIRTKMNKFFALIKTTEINLSKRQKRSIDNTLDHNLIEFTMQLSLESIGAKSVAQNLLAQHAKRWERLESIEQRETYEKYVYEIAKLLLWRSI